MAEVTINDPIRLRAVIGWEGSGVIRRKMVRFFDVESGRELVGVGPNASVEMFVDGPLSASLMVDLVDVELREGGC